MNQISLMMQTNTSSTLLSMFMKDLGLGYMAPTEEEMKSWVTFPQELEAAGSPSQK
jgi:hypothetical protein